MYMHPYKHLTAELHFNLYTLPPELGKLEITTRFCCIRFNKNYDQDQMIRDMKFYSVFLSAHNFTWK